MTEKLYYIIELSKEPTLHTFKHVETRDMYAMALAMLNIKFIIPEELEHI